MAVKRGASAAGNVDDERVVDHETMHVVVHSSPRYGRFLGIGIFGGLIVAAVLTFFSGMTEGTNGPMSSGFSGALLVYMVDASVCVAIGLFIMGSLAIFFDRRSHRRARSATAEHATTLVMNMDAPVTDDVPVWARDSDDIR